MSDKFYTSFYVDDGEVTYSNVKPTEDKKVLARMLADNPFLEWLEDEILEQTQIGTEDTKDSFKGRWNAYTLKKCRNKYLTIMGQLREDELSKVVADRIWTPVDNRLPVEDGWYIATLDGSGYGETGRTIDVSHFVGGRWVNAEGDYEKVYAWLDAKPYAGN